MRLMFIPASLVATLALAASPVPSLLDLSPMQPKGRVQDHSSDPVVESILAAGKDAIPTLINLIQSERMFDHPPLAYWPEVREGDMALVTLCDLFLDQTWKKSTLPELCWDNLLGRTDSDTSAWDLLYRYIGEYGRSSLADKWKAVWLEHRSRIAWDKEGRYFKVGGMELQACQ